jgi:hypothetical protein
MPLGRTISVLVNGLFRLFDSDPHGKEVMRTFTVGYVDLLI